MRSDSLSLINSDLTNEDNEKFVFGVKDGVRGFFTNPSRADDCFVPFIKECTQFELIHAHPYGNFNYTVPEDKGGLYLIVVYNSSVSSVSDNLLNIGVVYISTYMAFNVKPGDILDVTLSSPTKGSIDVFRIF